MDKATKIAHRVLPAIGSEWPLSAEGRAIAIGYAADIIRAEIAAVYDECAKAVDDLEETWARGSDEQDALARAAVEIRKLKPKQ